MELIKFKILYWWSSKPKNNKAKELQLNLYLWFKPTIDFKIDLSQYDTNIFKFDLDLFGVLKLWVSKNKKTDHAGFRFNLNLLGLDFDYSYYDTRNWNYYNNSWEIYE